MKHFTYEEMELMSIYDPGTREGLIANLEEMRGFLEPDEDELREIDETAHRRLSEMMPQMAKEAGVTEALKAADPMKWAGLMNTLKAQAEEIILNELVFS